MGIWNASRRASKTLVNKKPCRWKCTYWNYCWYRGLTQNSGSEQAPSNVKPAAPSTAKKITHESDSQWIPSAQEPIPRLDNVIHLAEEIKSTPSPSEKRKHRRAKKHGDESIPTAASKDKKEKLTKSWKFSPMNKIEILLNNQLLEVDLNDLQGNDDTLIAILSKDEVNHKLYLEFAVGSINQFEYHKRGMTREFEKFLFAGKKHAVGIGRLTRLSMEHDSALYLASQYHLRLLYRISKEIVWGEYGFDSGTSAVVAGSLQSSRTITQRDWTDYSIR